MKEIGFGIVGSGAVSKYHIQAIADIKGARLVGICSADKKTAESLAREHNIRYFGSLDEMIASEDIEAVNVCTSSGSHAEIAEKLLTCGKHVMVEKPLAMNVTDAERICKAARKSGKLCSVVSQLRFFESVIAARDAIKSGRLGRITIANAQMKYYRSPEYYEAAAWRGTWEQDGGVLMNQGIHGIDLLRYLVGEAVAVSAVSKTLFHKIEADDTSAALIEFENGAVGVVEGTTSVYPGYDIVIEICGTKGSIRLEGNKIVRWDIKDCADKAFGEENAISSGTDPLAISHIGHRMQIENMVRAIEGSEELISDCESGRKTVELINAIYLSAKTNNRVLI